MQLRIPVTIISGFLGSGKTTLLNRLLRSAPGIRLAVIVNEFGDIGVDGSLIPGGETFVELDNGCLCCALNQDLELLLRQLMSRGGFDHLMIETTGLADPLSVAWTFERPGLHEYYRVDAIVSVVDALNIGRALTEAEECQIQIEQADILILNKLDLVADGGTEAEAEIRRYNASSPILKSVQAGIPWHLLLLTEADERHLPAAGHEPHRHGDFESWSFHPEEITSVERLEDFFLEIPRSVYRIKGLLKSDAPTGWSLLHVVAGRFDLSAFTPDREGERSRLVFIGRDLDRDALLRLCRSLATETRGPA